MLGSAVNGRGRPQELRASGNLVRGLEAPVQGPQISSRRSDCWTGSSPPRVSDVSGRPPADPPASPPPAAPASQPHHPRGSGLQPATDSQPREIFTPQGVRNGHPRLLVYLGGARGGFLGWTLAVMGVIVRVRPTSSPVPVPGRRIGSSCRCSRIRGRRCRPVPPRSPGGRSGRDRWPCGPVMSWAPGTRTRHSVRCTGRGTRGGHRHLSRESAFCPALAHPLTSLMPTGTRRQLSSAVFLERRDS